jgi:mannosyltransferase OCH1-like enzyme
LIETHGIPSPDAGNEWHHAPMMVSDFFDAFINNNFAMFSMVNGGQVMDFSYVKLHPDFRGSTGKLPGPEKPKFLDKVALAQLPFQPGLPPSISKIPPLAVFVHKTLLFETGNPVDSLFAAGATVIKFTAAWGETEANSWVVDHLTCLAALNAVKADLVSFFREEESEARRVEMCRAAALYVAGGYYFDVDFQLKNMTLAADDTSLLLARDGDDFSRKFIAVEPRSSIMMLTLDNILDIYKKEPGQATLDPLNQALLSLKSTVKAEVVSLKDVEEEKYLPWILDLSSPNINSIGSYNISTHNPVPIDMRGPPSQEFKIPRRIIFTYKDNILETKDPPVLYENMLNTIQKYREEWGDPNAPVWLLTDADCVNAIHLARPNLVNYFVREEAGSWKADMCRAAALYLTGGYYFDVDIEVVEPWKHGSNVTFATAATQGTNRFFQAFVASEKEGRVIEKSLSEMLLFYETKRSRANLLGCVTMKWAYELIPVSERGETVILEELPFPRDRLESPERRDAVGCCCEFGVQDPYTKQHAFYSRVVGASSFCTPRVPEDQVIGAAG